MKLITVRREKARWELRSQRGRLCSNMHLLRSYLQKSWRMPRNGRRSWPRAGLGSRNAPARSSARSSCLFSARLLEQAQHQILELTSAKRQASPIAIALLPQSSTQDEAGEILADIDLEARSRTQPRRVAAE